MGLISFIIPCYNSAGSICGVVDEIEDAVKDIGHDDYEIILINDSSPDNVFEVIIRLCENNRRIRGIDLAKNFGQHAALMAGIRSVRGDIAVFLDDDGQTPACEVGKMLSTLDDAGCDVVFAKYESKQHSFLRNIGTKINDYMAATLIGKPKGLSLTSYIACKRFVVDEIKRYEGNYPYMAGLLLRATDKIKNVQINHRKRAHGRSGYTLKKLFALWLNGFTAFSVKPLRVATVFGFLTAMSGFVFGLYVIVRRILNPDMPIGYSSMMAALLFIGGMIMLMLGAIGEYIGRTYLNVNNAPQYVIRKRIGFEDES